MQILAGLGNLGTRRSGRLKQISAIISTAFDDVDVRPGRAQSL